MIALKTETVQAYYGSIVIGGNVSVSPNTAPIQRIGNLYLVTDDINIDAGPAIVIQRNASNIVLDGQGHVLTGGIYAAALVENVTIKNFEINGGITLGIETRNIVIHKNKISGGGTGVGISIDYSNGYNEITENTITGFSYAIDSAMDCSVAYTKIANNNITSNKNGITFNARSYNNTVVENNISDNAAGYGIYFEGGERNYVAGNILARNRIAIYMTNFYWGSAGQYGTGVSQNNTIVDNYIASNTEVGISIVNGTSSPFAQFWFGSHLPNYIYHNIFKENPNHVTFQHEIAAYNWTDDTFYTALVNSTNVMDDGYPSGGNYWSDYTGVDSDGDGIGDTPYVIDEYNEDRYPLLMSNNKPNWEYVFRDRKHGTTLKISTDDQCFQFVSRSRRFEVKKASRMMIHRGTIYIWHKDSELKLTAKVNTRHRTYCFASVSDRQNHRHFILRASQSSVPTEYSLTISAGDGGATSPAIGTYWYDENEKVQVTANPYTDYVFDHWNLDGEYYSSNPTTTVTMNNHHNLQANFAYIYHQVTVPAYDNYGNPVTTNVYIDGQYVGTTGNSFQVAEGYHTIGVSVPDGYTLQSLTSGTTTWHETSVNLQFASDTIITAYYNTEKIPVTITVDSVPHDDYSRYHALTLNNSIPQTFWTGEWYNQNPDAIIAVTGRTLHYEETFYLTPGQYELEYAVSCWVGYWDATIRVNGVVVADENTNVYNHITTQITVT